MNLYIVLSIIFVASCYSSPILTPNIMIPNLEDAEIKEIMKSLNLASSLLNNNPTYIKVEKQVEDLNRDENGQFYITENTKRQPEGLEVEYDTTKLLVKNPPKQENVVKMYYPFAEENQQQFAENNQQQSNKQYVPEENKDEYEVVQSQEQEEQVTKEKYQLEDNFSPSETEEDIFSSPEEQLCDLKCDAEEIPICAINVKNKYSIFRNACEMRMSNCLNPEIDWQEIPREMCKKALSGFFNVIHKYFFMEEESKENELEDEVN